MANFSGIVNIPVMFLSHVNKKNIIRYGKTRGSLRQLSFLYSDSAHQINGEVWQSSVVRIFKNRTVVTIATCTCWLQWLAFRRRYRQRHERRQQQQHPRRSSDVTDARHRDSVTHFNDLWIRLDDTRSQSHHHKSHKLRPLLMYPRYKKTRSSV